MNNQQLKIENEDLYKEYQDLAKINLELDEENERLRGALERIQNWAKAYPLAVFPKPDLKKAHSILKAAGMTLGAISADAMRHVLDGIKNIVEQALEEDK